MHCPACGADLPKKTRRCLFCKHEIGTPTARQEGRDEYGVVQGRPDRMRRKKGLRAWMSLESSLLFPFLFGIGGLVAGCLFSFYNDPDPNLPFSHPARYAPIIGGSMIAFIAGDLLRRLAAEHMDE